MKTKKSKATNFAKRLSDVAQEALVFIQKSVKKGEYLRLFTEKEEEKSEGQIIYDMPNVSRVDKYSNYEEFAIVALSNVLGELVIVLAGKGESEGDRKEIKLSELSGSESEFSDLDLCNLADLISELI